eukprot:767230-Hanusia_phi.AAC.11
MADSTRSPSGGIYLVKDIDGMICDVCLCELGNRFEENPPNVDSNVSISDDRDAGNRLQACDEIGIERMPVVPATACIIG